jgi:RNA polymerase sigma-70 factor (ECF subfamily)
MTMPQPNPLSISPLARAGAPALSDYGLVERVRAGDAAAFELIMRRHNRRLYRLARSVLRNALEAEDVVQETYVRAFAKLDDFIGPDGFSAWLARIAYNEALGRARGRATIFAPCSCCARSRA